MEEEPRDTLWEDIVIRELRKKGESQGANTSHVTISRALRRLAIGDQKYGNSFRSRDILQSARNKAADIVAYSLLEAQKRNSQGRDGQHHLLEAATHALLAEYYLLLSQQSRD